MNWEICDFQSSFLPALRQLYLETRIQTFSWLDPSTFQLSDFDTAIQGEGILIALSDGQPVGFISWWAPDNFIHNLYVDANFARLGIGKALLNQCLTQIGRPATLKCLQQNENALSFYRAQGWTIHTAGQSADGNYFLMALDQ